MATIHELLDLIITTAQQLKGEAPTDVPVPAPDVKPSRFVNGKTAPDSLGRVELELIDRLIAEFGEAPNGYKIPKLWYVPGVEVSHLPLSVQGDYQQNVGGAGFNTSIAYTYKDEYSGWFGKKIRVQDGGLPGTLCWNGSLADLEAALRAKIAVNLNPNQTPAYTPRPDAGVLDTVAGYLGLKKPIA